MSFRESFDLNRALPAVAALLAAVILLGTAAALIAGKRPGQSFRKSDPQGVSQLKGKEAGQSEFKEFGTLRIRLLPGENSSEPGAILVVSPWLSYASGDSAFYEELVSKKKMFSAYIQEYFSTKTKNALLSAGEKEIKRALLERFNGQLSLGKLSGIYFDEYMFIEEAL